MNEKEEKNQAVPSSESPKTDSLKAEFTPGPWEVVAADDYFVEAPNTEIEPPKYVDNNLIRPAICKTICEVGNQTLDCGEANARLIAAAPDLYFALQGALSELQYWHAKHPGENGPANIDDAKAALALANGQVTRECRDHDESLAQSSSSY